MKKFFLAFCVSLFGLCSGMTVSVTSEPEKVVNGGEVLVKIEVDKTGDIDFVLPEVANGQWLKNSMRKALFHSRRFVNFKESNVITNSCSLLLVNTGGKSMTIPPFEVKCGGESAWSKELVIPVVSAAQVAEQAADSTGDCMGKIIISGEHYVGEKINFELALQIPENVKLLQMEEPRLSGFQDVTFSRMQYADDSRSRKLSPATKYRCRGFFTPWKPGEYDLSATQRLKIIKFDLNGGNRHPFPEIISVIYPADQKLQVLPLPEAPENVYFLGLVGDWELHAEIVPEKLHTGDSAKLIVSGRGDGNIELLTTPEITIPGFRCYHGDAKKNQDSFQISYQLVALEARKAGEKLQFAVFDAPNKRYNILTVDLPEVLPGKILPTASALPETPTQNANVAMAMATENSGLIPVVRKSDGAKIRLPLWKNCRNLIGVILLVAVVLAVAIFIWTSRRDHAAARQAKKTIAEARDKLMKMLSSGNISAEDILPRLATVLKLPAGATATEIISAAGNDHAIREIVEKCEEAEFSPGEKTLKISEKIRLDALAFIRRCSLILLCGTFAFSLFANDGETKFYAGNYREAAEFFRNACASDKAVDVDMLYDLGCAEYNCGNYPAAKSAFFRAQLLAPRNSEIAEKLDLVNAKLGQSTHKKAETFREVVADWQNRFRPDNYLVIAASAAALLIVLLGSRSIVGKKLLAGFGALLVPVIALSLWSVWQQTRTSYDSRQAVVVAMEAKIHALPQENSQVIATIPGGSHLLVLDRNLAPWLLVECNGIRGWTNAESVEMSLPGGVWGK